MAGQSLVEFAVLALGLVLFGGGVTLLSRFQSIERQAVLAARQAAFRPALARVPPAADAALRSIRTLHFRNGGWTDPAGRARLLVDDDVGLSLAESGAPGRAGELATHILSPLTAPGGYLTDGLSFGSPGYRLAEVTAGLRPVAGWAPFDALSLSLSARAAILGNGWSASGPAQVRDRAAGLVPTALLREPLQVLQPFRSVLALFEPALERLCIGQIEPERVPADRLDPGLPLVPAALQDCR